MKEGTIKGTKHLAKSDIRRQLAELDAQMRAAAEKLDFERAIELRDTITEMNHELDRKMENELYIQKKTGLKQKG